MKVVVALVAGVAAAAAAAVVAAAVAAAAAAQLLNMTTAQRSGLKKAGVTHVGAGGCMPGCAFCHVL